MSRFTADIRFALRTLRRQPLFTFVAVLTLAIGIGTTTTLYTLVHDLLMKPLPAEDVDRLVAVYTTSNDEQYSSSSFADWSDLRKQSQTLQDLAGYTRFLANVAVGPTAEMTLGEMVTDNYFDLLGIPVALGRAFTPEENTVSGPGRVAVLGYGYWQDMFGGDPSALGKDLRINGKPYTVIGVAPRWFEGMTPGVANTIWLPAARAVEIDAAGLIDSVPSPTGNNTVERRGDRWMMLIGRLADGATVDNAQSELNVLMAALAAEYPDTNKERAAEVLSARDVRLHPSIDAVTSAASIVLFGIVGLVLLVACANIAGLLIAKATGRRREVAVRLALGANRGWIMRQLLTESVVLSVLGGIAGTVLAWWLVRGIVAFQPEQFGFESQFAFSLDPAVLLFALLVTGACGVLFGLVPALQASSEDLTGFMKEGSGERTGRRGAGRIRDLLVVAQIAVSAVLLVGAGLMTRSLGSARQADLGMDASRVAVLTTSFEMHGYDADASRQFIERMRQQVAAMPEVEAASFTMRAPITINLWRNDLIVQGHQQTEDDDPYLVDVTYIDEDYFDVLGTPILEGRAITSDDVQGSAEVIVVNSAFAERYWPGEDPIGKWVRRNALDGPRLEVVGVCADYKVQSVTEKPRPFVHYSRYQRSNSAGTILVRTRGPAEALLPAITARIRGLDPDLTFFESGTLLSSTAITLSPLKFGSMLLTGSGILAVLLASIGLYGVIAYSVSRRRREIGIRIALGAERGDVILGVLRQGLPVTAAGLIVGLIVAFLTSGAISSVLYGVSSADPASYITAVAVLLAVAAAAHLMPAARAVRTDPAQTLREL